MTYQEALQFWFRRVNHEQKLPRVGDFKLDSMRALLAALGNPHERLRIVHVAGSKGKGSTAAMLASIFRQAGYRTGLFTSPHLVRVEERIQVDRVPIAEDEVVTRMVEIRDACAAPRSPARGLEPELTFFEISTALGFLHFVRRRVDLAVVEVGLGGRFDSTNVCLPLVAVLTSISLDHTQLLGNTLASIAFEKAGIIKPGRPVVSGVRTPEARAVVRQVCAERGAPLTEIDTDFSFQHQPAQVLDGTCSPATVQVDFGSRRGAPMALGLMGAHQASNAAVAVATVERLQALGVPVGEAAVRAGLAQVQWPARMEVLGWRPLVVLDCAHNVASAQALVQALRESFPLPPTGRRLLVFAGSRDKDLPGMLEVLAPCFDRTFLTTFRTSPRAVPAEELWTMVPAAYQAASTVCGDADNAWQRARAEAGTDDLICITGSVFLAGDLRPALVAAEPS